MRPGRLSTAQDGYPRPQHPWQCGLADDGPPCPSGPDDCGHCPLAAACHPVREGDRWRCNRSELRGGPCIDGPGPNGACAVVYQCMPVRAQRTKRGKLVAGVALAALGGAVMALSGGWRNRIIAPGPLSAAHGQLVAGDSSTSGCAKCHAAGGATLAAWGEHTVGEQPLEVSQTSLCMECHDKSFAAEVALAAHTMPLNQLNKLAGVRDDPARSALRDPGEPIACATCHREHQGSAHDLAAVSNQACQACHRERFHSFDNGHPDFDAWPYERPTRIAFDHASHQDKHFAAAKQAFDCATCHAADSTGQRQLTLNYATSCAGCHDKALVASLADGVPLVSLPTIDVEAMKQAGHDVGAWPEEADGDFDGALPLAAKLLATADPHGAAALQKLGAGFDFYDVDPDDSEQLAAAADVVAVLKELIADVAQRGQPALIERLEKVLSRELTPAEREALAARLSPDVAQAYAARWLGAAGEAGFSGPGADRTTQQQKLPGGGWLRDDATLSLRYQPIGHDDPWLRAWLDMLAEAAAGPQRAVAEPLLRAALKPTAPGQCGSCHTLEQYSAGRLSINWRALRPDDERSNLTRFVHGAHLTQPTLRDCTACHRTGRLSDQSSAPVGAAGVTTAADFQAISKAACAECHIPHAAGDNCTQCHRYHGR